MRKYQVSDIKWDIDNIEDLDNLPTELVIRASSRDEIADILSDNYGFCVDGFSAERIS